MMRKEPIPSTIHVFSTQFYTKFVNEGFECVEKWTRKMNIFEKEILLIPINDSGHWSLCVIFHPGEIVNGAKVWEMLRKKLSISEYEND